MTGVPGVRIAEQRSNRAEPSSGAPERPAGAAKPTFRPDIEGLRAVAVGLVVLGHAGFPYLDGGYVGVDVFFVISGFLITSLLLRELAGTGGISVVGFYARRATRLLPMAVTVTVTTLAASWLWLAPTRFQSIAEDALASSLYFVNYRLAFEGTDYLNADEAPSPFQHYWSLAVEEQFYLVWPLLLLAVALVARRSGRRATTGLAAVLVAAAAATFAAGALLTPLDPVWSYFGLHTRGWELALGSLVAVAAAGLARMPGALASTLMWGGLAAIVWSAFAFDDATVFPGAAAAVPVLGAAAAIAGGCASPRLGAGGVLGLPGFQILGRLSYGLYLWHWPILMIGPAALGLESTVRLNLVLVVAALGITAVTYEVVENPVRFASWFKRRPARGAGFGIAATAATAALAVLAASSFAPSATGTGESVEVAETGTAAEVQELLRESNAVSEAPSNLTPAPLDAKGDLAEIYGSGCHASLETVDAEPCVFGDEDGPEVALFGDSHAASWFPSLEILADQEGWKLSSYTKSACPAPQIVKDNTELGGRYHQCEEWRESVLDRFADSPPDLVVVASSENNDPITEPGTDGDEAWLDGWDSTLDRLTGSGSEVTLLSNPPKFEESVPDCVSANLDDVSACGGPADELIRHRDREREALAIAEELGVRAVDTTGWFCADGTCPAVVGNMIAYRDSHHFSVTYAEFLAPVLATELPDL